jgi:hypothetical protein
MKTHDPLVTNIFLWLTILSPLISLIIAFFGASFFTQPTG